jgi:hypothetical protein
MKINESKDKELQLINGSLQVAGKSVKFAKQNLKTLNMGNDIDDEEEEDEPGNLNIDPSCFMTRQEAAQWNRLSDSQKNKFVKDGIREAERSFRAKSKGKTTSILFQEYLQDKELETDMAAVSHLPQSHKSNRADRYPGKKADTGREKNVQQNILSSQIPAQGITTQGDASKFVESGGQAASKIIGTETTGAIAAQASEAAATGGVNLALEAGKRAASAFKESIEAHAVVADKAIYSAQQKMQAVKAQNKEMGTLPSAVTYIGAAVAAAFLSVAAVIVQAAVALVTSLLAVLVTVAVTVVVAVVIVGVLASIIAAIVSSLDKNGTGGAEQIVSVALAEEGVTDGTKYWTYTMGSAFSDGNTTPWCACFVSWCANECGYLDEGTFPKSASVATYRRFFREKNQLHEEKSYIPKTGDLILFGADEHIGIVQYTEGGRVITIEGNTSDAVHSRSYELGSSYITGYCAPEYPEGAQIVIPDGMGIYHTYMGWQTITSPTSLQYQLREASREHYDTEGFAKIDGRYVIACTTTFGSVGDYVDFYREDGSIVHTVIGDIKNQDDPGCNKYGHADGQCVVEYVVQKSTWYPIHANPGSSGCHPEWNSRVVKAVKLGKNYFK